MIRNSEPLSMTESLGYLDKDKESESEVMGFMKKFVKLKPKEGIELRKKLKGLELMKMRDIHVVKIIDLLPESGEELNKIFIDVGLDKDETKKILETVKEFK